MFFFKSSKLIGLDIGTSFIKLAEVDFTRTGATLLSFGIVPTPSGAISSRGEIVDTASVASVIANLIKDVKSKRKNVATAMWGSAVMVKKITGPRMQAKDLEANLRFEAEQYIPFDVNEINLDFALLNKNTSPETMDYLLIAAQKEFLFKLAEVVETAGLECTIVDVAGFSLANCFQFNYGTVPNEVIALINCGAGVTNFTVIENGDVTFCRDIPVGGLTFTNEIHKQLAVSVPEAEALKLSASTGQNAPQEVTDLLNSTLNSVAEEIHRGFDFFAATSQDVQIQRILTTGGSSLIPGFNEKLSELTGVKAERFNPFLKTGYNTKLMNQDYINQISPYVAVSLGLALRKVGDR